jgi:hypothetical protein
MRSPPVAIRRAEAGAPGFCDGSIQVSEIETCGTRLGEMSPNRLWQMESIIRRSRVRRDGLNLTLAVSVDEVAEVQF